MRGSTSRWPPWRWRRQNAAANGVAERVVFRQGDLFALDGGPYELIVSNPPYIAVGEMPTLMPEVRDFEPSPGPYRRGGRPRLLPGAGAGGDRAIEPDGWLLVEVGAGSGRSGVRAFCRGRVTGNLHHPRPRRDRTGGRGQENVGAHERPGRTRLLHSRTTGVLLWTNLIIHGGKRLRGEVSISGSKNASLPIFFATLLAAGQYEIDNVPFLRDINTTIKLLETPRRQGRRARPSGQGRYHRRRSGRGDLRSGQDHARLGARPRTACWPASAGPGSPSPAAAPSAPARSISISRGWRPSAPRFASPTVTSRPRPSSCIGARIYFDVSTVGGTEHLMMTAALAKGETILENAAREPEIPELAAFLTKMGARIEGAGTDTIRIIGVDELQPCCHEVMPDRIEAGTFMIAAAITGGDVTFKLKPIFTGPEQT